MRPERSRTPLYDAMLNEARELFARRGYHGASIRDITASAGSSEALVYRHFGSKHELYRRAVIDELEHVIRHYLDAGDAPESAGAPRIADEIGRLYDLLADNTALMRSLAENSTLKNDPAALLTAAGPPLQSVFERLERMISAAVPSGIAVNVPVAARACVGFTMAVTIFDDWLFDELQNRPTRDHAVEQLTQLMLFGCTARPDGAEPEPMPVPVPMMLHSATHPQDGTGTRIRVQPEQRRRRSRHEVKRLILESARGLFSEIGYESATTRAIAERAGVAETSVFHHFGSKRALFESAISDRFDPWIASYLHRWGAADRTTSSLEVQSREYVSATYDMLTADRALMRLAFSSLRDQDLSTERSASPLHQNFLRIEYQLNQIAIDNHIRGLDPALVLRPTFGMLYALAALTEWMFGPDGPPSRDSLVDEITAIMVYGITARPGNAAAAHPDGQVRDW